MKKEDCFFYPNNKCLIFKNCNDKKVEKCDWFRNKKTGCPEHFISHLMFVNTITQAKAIISQRRYSKILIGVSIVLALLAAIQIYSIFIK